jgi:hypothetical protein
MLQPLFLAHRLIFTQLLEAGNLEVGNLFLEKAGLTPGFFVFIEHTLRLELP